MVLAAGALDRDQLVAFVQRNRNDAAAHDVAVRAEGCLLHQPALGRQDQVRRCRVVLQRDDLRDGLVRVVEADVANVRLLWIRRAAPARWRVEREVVESPVCREHEIGRDVAVARLHDDGPERRAEGDLHRFLVADFADEDDVRVLTQEAAQRGGEVEADVLADLHLVDAKEVELDRVLGRHDVRVGRVDPGDG